MPFSPNAAPPPGLRPPMSGPPPLTAPAPMARPPMPGAGLPPRPAMVGAPPMPAPGAQPKVPPRLAHHVDAGNPMQAAMLHRVDRLSPQDIAAIDNPQVIAALRKLLPEIAFLWNDLAQRGHPFGAGRAPGAMPPRPPMPPALRPPDAVSPGPGAPPAGAPQPVMPPRPLSPGGPAPLAPRPKTALGRM